MSSKRTISATNEAGFASKSIKFILSARLDFSSGVKRFHTEIGPKTLTSPIHGAEVYDGIGDFGGIATDVKESISAAPIGVTLALSGVNSSLIDTAFTDDYFRRDAEVMIGLEDSDGDMIDDPEILYSGYMDKIEIALVKNQSTFMVYLESRGTNLLTSSDWRFTDEDKQREVPGDLFAEYIYRMADLVLRWGSHGWSPSGIPPDYKEPGRNPQGR